MKLPILALLTIASAFSQVQPDFRSNTCLTESSTPKLMIYMPAEVIVDGQKSVTNVPVCVALRGDLRIDMTSPNGPVLEVVRQPIPVQREETVFLDPATPPEKETLEIRLKLQPAEGWPLITVLISSVGDAFRIKTPVGPDQKLVKVRLPLHRPFVEKDAVTIIYWAYE